MMLLIAQVPTPQQMNEFTQTLITIGERFGTPFIVLVGVFVFGWLGLRYLALSKTQEGKSDEAQARKDEAFYQQIGRALDRISANADRYADLNERSLNIAQIQIDAQSENSARDLEIAKEFSEVTKILRQIHDTLPEKIATEVRSIAQGNLNRYNEAQKDIESKQGELTQAVNALEQDSNAMKEEIQEIKTDVKSLLQKHQNIDELVKRLTSIESKLDALLAAHDTSEIPVINPTKES